VIKKQNKERKKKVLLDPTRGSVSARACLEI
jgi:hypothetical protein